MLLFSRPFFFYYYGGDNMKWYKFWKNLAVFFEKLGIFTMFIAICIGIMVDKTGGFVGGLLAIVFVLIGMLCRWFSQ